MLNEIVNAYFATAKWPILTIIFALCYPTSVNKTQFHHELLCHLSKIFLTHSYTVFTALFGNLTGLPAFNAHKRLNVLFWWEKDYSFSFYFTLSTSRIIFDNNNPSPSTFTCESSVVGRYLRRRSLLSCIPLWNVSNRRVTLDNEEALFEKYE